MSKAPKASKDRGSATYVALLRGINVGGKNVLSMRDLAAICEACGGREVQTFLQSGNVLFRATPAVAAKASAAITRRLAETHGLDVPVVLRSAEALRAIVAAAPFADAGLEPDKLHVVFLAERPTAERVATIDPHRSPPDRCELIGAEIYLRTPNGAARTKYTAAYFDARLGTVGTARNWRTVTKLAELVGASGEGEARANAAGISERSPEPPAGEEAATPCSFASASAWDAWLREHHRAASGLWLKLVKGAGGRASLTYAEAVEIALAWGWIDGQKKAHDDAWWLQRFTPRTAKSPWSKINRAKAEALVAAGRMNPAGLAEVERAKADGRWDAAYDSPKTATVPDDLARALAADRRAEAFFATLDGANRYAILYRVQSAKKPETRAARIANFVAMLARGETIHPPRGSARKAAPATSTRGSTRRR